MKKIAYVLIGLSLLLTLCAFGPKGNRRTVVFRSTVECRGCQEKVMGNIPFEKGVKDVAVDLPEKTITIVFDDAKTDTLTLATSIRKLGYGAKVIRYE